MFSFSRFSVLHRVPCSASPGCCSLYTDDWRSLFAKLSLLKIPGNLLVKSSSLYILLVIHIPVMTCISWIFSELWLACSLISFPIYSSVSLFSATRIPYTCWTASLILIWRNRFWESNVDYWWCNDHPQRKMKQFYSSGWARMRPWGCIVHVQNVQVM